MKKQISGLAVIMVLLPCSVAFAQEAEALDAEATEASSADGAMEAEATEDATLEEALAEEAPVETTAAPPASGKRTSANGDDGPRFRFGISAGGGFLAGPVSGGYGGGDLRLGVQVNDLVAVYAQPQLGYYGADGFSIGGGLVGASAIVDVTLIDRFFVGAGGGYAILNSPSGPELHFRFGGYPVMARSTKGMNRKGLSLAVDLRMFFVDGYDMFVSPTLNIGYEAF